jgi:hypothetical protein
MLARVKPLAYLATSSVTKKFYNIDYICNWGKMYSVLLAKRPNKLECLSQKEFPALCNIKPGADPRWEHQKGVYTQAGLSLTYKY